MNKWFMLAVILTGMIAVYSVDNTAFGFCFQSNLPTAYPSHSCSKPELPPCVYSKDCNQDEISLAKIQIENYRICITGYLNDVEDHIECARDRASEARDEYNNFVNSVK